MPKRLCFSWILLFSIATTPRASGGPLPQGTTTSITPTVMTTSETTTLHDRQEPSWLQEESAEQGERRRSSLSLISADSGCRERVFCEAARTLTYIFPLSNSWQAIVREEPEPQNAYFAAWSKGLQSQDCSQLYPDCSDSPAALVIPIINQAVGPEGLVGSFLKRFVVPRDASASRTSLVMQKLREGERLSGTPVPRNQSDDFRLRST